jgi:hypothetical protein
VSIWLLLAIIAGLALIGVYLSWTAGRLDRMHTRTNAAWASLDAQLVRRAAVAAELAHEAAPRGLLGADAAAALESAAQRAVEAGTGPERAVVENALGRALRDALADPVGDVLSGDAGLAPVLAALDAAMTKVVLARRFHATAVEDTFALRRTRVVRWFRLAGSAPLPAYFDIDDTPATLRISTAAGPR